MEHYDLNAERSLIYALGTTTDHARKIFRELQADDFFDNTCKRRFKKYHKAFQAGQLSEFATQHMAELDIPESIIPIWQAVKTIQNHAIRRKVEQAMFEITEKCRDYSYDIKDVQSGIKDTLIQAIDSRACKAPTETGEDLERVMDGMQNTTVAFYTGIADVDRNAPIQPGDFVVLAARPGVGKSALSTGMIIANFMGKEKRRGIFFCIEMDVRQNYARISSQMCSVPLSKYINAKVNPPTKGELQSICDSFAGIKSEFPDRWFVEGAISIDEIADMVEIYKPDWIMVDYVQIVKCKGDGWEKFSNLSTRLRMLALEQSVAVIAIAQLNRDSNGGIPHMSQIKNSGQFEQDATHIFLLDRPESEPLNTVAKRSYYSKAGYEVEIFNKTNPTNMASLICSKNRNGAPFYTLLRFDAKTTSFKEYE